MMMRPEAGPSQRRPKLKNIWSQLAIDLEEEVKSRYKVETRPGAQTHKVGLSESEAGSKQGIGPCDGTEYSAKLQKECSDVSKCSVAEGTGPAKDAGRNTPPRTGE